MEQPDVSNSVADENIRAVARLQARAARQRSASERFSDAVSEVASRESAVILHAILFVLWIGANVRLLPIRPFDPYPFNMLTTIVSLEAIFLTLFVLASQKRLTADADRRAHLDLQINLLSEQEMTLVLQMLKEVCDHLGLRETTQSDKFKALAKRTDVSELAEHLQRGVAGDRQLR
jgi:uncharacterized membrane protein